MDTDVEVIDSHVFHCIDAVFLTMISWLKSDYQLMFIGSWGFQYIPELPPKDILGEKLFSGFIMRSRDAVYKYHGIRVEWETAASYEILADEIRKHLENDQSIGIYIDAYYCPWNPVYQQTHLNHYCIVTGFDSDEENYICVDTYFSCDTYHLPVDCLRKGFKEYLSFSKSDENRPKYSLKEILYDNLFNSDFIPYHDTITQNMIAFAQDICTKLDIKKEAEKSGGDITVSRLILKIQNIGRYRAKFAISLRYLAKNFEQYRLEEMACKLDEAAKEWSSISIFILKYFYSENTLLKEKLSEKIIDLARFEREIRQELIMFNDTL